MITPGDGFMILLALGPALPRNEFFKAIISDLETLDWRKHGTGKTDAVSWRKFPRTWKRCFSYRMRNSNKKCSYVPPNLSA